MNKLTDTDRFMKTLEQEFSNIYHQAVKDVGYAVFKEAVLDNMMQTEQELKLVA